MKLVTASQMREFEQRADAGGNSYGTMMERAGKAVSDAMAARIDVRDKNIVVLVGPGNNGGDGLVCARYLHDAGARVLLYIWKRALKDDDENLQLCLVRNIPFVSAEKDAGFGELNEQIKNCDVVVDALLGTGVTRSIEGNLRDLLNVIKARSPHRSISQSLFPSSPAPRRSPLVVAVDLPSGLNPDSGAIDPSTLDADLTVTFAFPKIGQLLFPGANAVGELIVADIGIHEEWASEINIEVADASSISARLPARSRDSHKGTYGKAMVCAGSINFTGAASLAGSAASRAGAGLVTLALAQTIYPIVASAAHETTFVPLPDAKGVLIPTAARALRKHWAGYDALLIGPGFGRDEKTVGFVQRLLGLRKKQSSLNPLLLRGAGGIVIDADALYALAQSSEWWKHIAPNTAILTPHPGEMATLCDLTRDVVQADRIGIARKFAEAWQQVVVLKGAHSVAAAPDGRVTLIPFATPALATAGTGDVLAGTIVAMLAQGLALYDAAIVGAYVHGYAGKIAEEEIGRAGVVAADILPRLPKAIARVKSYFVQSAIRSF